MTNKRDTCGCAFNFDTLRTNIMSYTFRDQNGGLFNMIFVELELNSIFPKSLGYTLFSYYLNPNLQVKK
jgi:hypothetical protein